MEFNVYVHNLRSSAKNANQVVCQFSLYSYLKLRNIVPFFSVRHAETCILISVSLVMEFLGSAQLRAALQVQHFCLRSHWSKWPKIIWLHYWRTPRGARGVKKSGWPNWSPLCTVGQGVSVKEFFSKYFLILQWDFFFQNWLPHPAAAAAARQWCGRHCGSFACQKSAMAALTSAQTFLYTRQI